MQARQRHLQIMTPTPPAWIMDYVRGHATGGDSGEQAGAHYKEGPPKRLVRKGLRRQAQDSGDM